MQLSSFIKRSVAEMKEDIGILLHIKDKDCVAMEVRYLKSCYRQCTRFLTKSTATVTGTTEEETGDMILSDQCNNLLRLHKYRYID